MERLGVVRVVITIQKQVNLGILILITKNQSGHIGTMILEEAVQTVGEYSLMEV